MKRILTLAALLFVFLSAFAQQETFEFFDWDAVKHPLRKLEENNNSWYSPSDSKGNIWRQATIDGSKYAIQKNGQPIPLAPSPQEKTGYSYGSAYGFWVDEKDSKYMLIRGSKYVNSQAYYDHYMIVYDSLGKTTYISAEEIGDADSTESWYSAYPVKDKWLVIKQSKFLWGSKPLQSFPYSQTGVYSPYIYDLFYDKQSTLYWVQSPIGISSFHADGTFARRLSDKVIKGYTRDFDTQGRVLVTTTSGLYALQGKTETQIQVPGYAQLLPSSTVVPFSLSKGNYRLEGVCTSKGFYVSNGTSSSTYLFSEKQEIGFDSLWANVTTSSVVRLQEDSTLAFYYSTFYNASSKRGFLFKYKNNTTSLNRSYNWKKLGLEDAYFNIFAFYVGKNDSYFYLKQSHPSNIVQIKNDSTLSVFPFTNLSCSIDSGSMLADKDYLWISSSHSYSSNSECDLGRMSHADYFINGNVFYDANKNGSLDTWNGERSYSKVILVAQPSGLQLIPDYNGLFAFKGKQGVRYEVNVVDTARFTFIRKTYENKYSIGVKLKDEKPEIRSSFALPRARCATNPTASFLLENTGVLPVEKAVIKLYARKMKLIQNSVEVDTAKFEHSNLAVAESKWLSYDILWPDGQEVGQTAVLYTITDLYVGGKLASRQLDSLQTVIRCSYDPNDKIATPVGIGEQHYTLKANPISYQIRFENTGNDTAYHVMIADTLSNMFDLSTFQILGASHKMNTEIEANGAVKFHFNYIMLPDTHANKAAAQGYVRFSVKPKTSVPDYKEVCNTASIYFDQNPAVVTNKTCNLLVDKIPNIITDITASHSSTGGLMAYPNPNHGWLFAPIGAVEVQIYNALGSMVYSGNDSKINLHSQDQGIYIVKIRDERGITHTQKISLVK